MSDVIDKPRAMTLEDIAAELQMNKDTARRTVSQPDFPKGWHPFPGSRLRRWDRVAVEKWIEEQQA